MSESRARRIVRARSAGLCEVRILDDCLGRAMNFQHRKNRSQGGLWTPSNGIDVCGSGTTGCHGWIHANPAKATENGWTVRSWGEPAEVPALLHTVHYGHDFVLLDDQGCYALAPFPEGTAGHPDELPALAVLRERRRGMRNRRSTRKAFGRGSPSERAQGTWRELCELGLEPFMDRAAAEAELVARRYRRTRSGSTDRVNQVPRRCGYCPRWHLVEQKGRAALHVPLPDVPRLAHDVHVPTRETDQEGTAS